MRGYWREMGAAYIEGGPYGQFWVVEFGCRPNVLPVIAEPTASGGVTVRLSNEECTPHGTSEAIGKATEVMVSDKPDFSGAVLGAVRHHQDRQQAPATSSSATGTRRAGRSPPRRAARRATR